MSRRCLESDWRVSGGYQDCVWRESLRCLKDVFSRVSGGTTKGVWRVSGDTAKGIWSQDRSGQDMSSQVMSDQVKSGWVKSGQIRSGQGK